MHIDVKKYLNRMKRTAYAQFLKWKKSPYRKPLVIKGARQVGKTWLMKEFGKNEYRSVAYVNFEKTAQLSGIFEQDFDIQRILSSVQLITGVVPVAGETLIIFDEIQSVKRGLLSLKYFYEDAPEYHIVAAGSLLGLSIHEGESFPVGKVDFLNLYPLTFFEFMNAYGKAGLLDALRSRDWTLISAFRQQYIDLLRLYYYVGGMPEAISRFVENGNFSEVREVQNAILNAYDNDFSKHPPTNIVTRIKMVWNTIPTQLAKENKKFIFGALKSGGRAKDFEIAIMWLAEAGLLHQVNRCTNAELPLDGFADTVAFKLYLLDVGLLGAMVNLEAQTLLDGNAFFAQYKGAFTEQYVLQQLVAVVTPSVYYWTASEGKAEVDFLIQAGNTVLPIEVKAEENLKSKSLKSYRDKFHPSAVIRTSMSDYREDNGFFNIPLYGIDLLTEIMK